MIQRVCRAQLLLAMGSASPAQLTCSHCQVVAPKAHSGGLLVGWTEAGNRRVLRRQRHQLRRSDRTVCFLGASHDATFKDLFTSGIAGTLLRVDGLNAIFGSGAFKTEPLKLLIARYIDEDLLHLVADQHRRGRRLFVVTTNIDAQRTALWNMGAIAASDYSERLQLFRDILVASASAPGLFAPTYIQVQAGNVRFQEMHVDGAVTSNVLAVPESVLLQKVAFKVQRSPSSTSLLTVRLRQILRILRSSAMGRSRSSRARSTQLSRRTHEAL